MKKKKKENGKKYQNFELKIFEKKKKYRRLS